jgi:hypothetical protein
MPFTASAPGKARAITIRRAISRRITMRSGTEESTMALQPPPDSYASRRKRRSTPMPIPPARASEAAVRISSPLFNTALVRT